MDKEYIIQHIRQSIKEDIPSFDHSSLACIATDSQKKVKLMAKQEGILCGVDIFCMVFEELNTQNDIKIEKFMNDGDKLHYGDIILKISGNAINILSAERTALNYIQLLSGIATTTAEYVALLNGMHTQLLDTRKTTPSFRMLEKYAVKVGGAVNHRWLVGYDYA